jgi:NADPH:quinone reductase-like Zn-dependent oxidoreductase
MRAIRNHSYGDPSVLDVVDVPRPVAGPGEALVRVAGTTFNQIDATLRAGYLTDVFPFELPHIPGIDLSGTVISVGPGASDELVGHEVIAFLPMTAQGSAAEYVSVPAELLSPAPHSIPLPDAAALTSGGLTAWQTVERARVRAGQRVLVNGAGGGVGAFVVQLAARTGATVIATAGPRSRDAVTAHGATEVIDYTAVSVVDAVTRQVDAVVNLVRTTPDETAALVALVKTGGAFVSTTTPGVAVDDIRVSSIFVRSDATQLARLAKLVDAGELHVDVSARYPLNDLARVHTLGQAGALRGRVVLTPTER